MMFPLRSCVRIASYANTYPGRIGVVEYVPDGEWRDSRCVRLTQLEGERTRKLVLVDIAELEARHA